MPNEKTDRSQERIDQWVSEQVEEGKKYTDEAKGSGLTDAERKEFPVLLAHGQAIWSEVWVDEKDDVMETEEAVLL